MKRNSMNFYKVVTIATSALFVYLFSKLFFSSDSFVRNLGLQPSETVAILSRRASMFMLGLSILLFCSKNLPHSSARQFICLSTGITMVGLACMGSYELLMGTVNSSIWVAIIIETITGISFLTIFVKNRKAKVVQ